jgi:hypothetical protein
MKFLVPCSIALVSLLAATELSAQVCDVVSGGTVYTDGKQLPVTLVCRGGPRLEWARGYAGQPPRETARILKFVPASRPAGPQGLGLEPSQCGLTDRRLVPGQNLPEIRMDPASTSFTPGGAAPASTSLEAYLQDINHFWSFDTKICEGPQYKPRPLHASGHRVLEVPLLQQAGRTPGSPLGKATTPIAKGRSAGNSGSQQRGRINPAEKVILSPQPLPPKTTVLQPRDATVTASAPMRTTSGGGQTLLCRGGRAPAIGPYPLKADVQMMYFVAAEQPVHDDGSGLAPERCSFVDQPASDVGVNIVLFQATQKQGQDVTKSLESSDVYWRFVVSRNESGYLEASEHAQWAPAKDTRAAPVQFTRIRVDAGPSNVVFTFDGPADSQPRVMIVSGLKKNPDGGGGFDWPPLHLSAVKASSTKPSGIAEFVASSDQHRVEAAPGEKPLSLEPGTKYHYFLDHAGSKTRQEGDFTTQAVFDPANKTLEPQQAPIKNPGLKIPGTAVPARAGQ